MRLVEYPWVVVRVECRMCPRRGSYRLARLAERFGALADVDEVIGTLASDCRFMRDRPVRKYEARCGVRLPDLDLRRPPPDVPV